MSNLYQLRLRPRPPEEGVVPAELAVLLGDSRLVAEKAEVVRERRNAKDKQGDELGEATPNGSHL